LGRRGRYRVVREKGTGAKDASPLSVKEVLLRGRRYVVCYNEDEAKKQAGDREAILAALEDRLSRQGAKSLIGNKGYRKYLSMKRGAVAIDRKKVDGEARYDGKWVLTTNTDLPTAEVALRYKELWEVEALFRSIKSVLATRPIYHKSDETIRGHVFCSFLALMLRKELQERLRAKGFSCEWADVIRDVDNLSVTVVKDGEKVQEVRSSCRGDCGKVFQAVGVAVPPMVRTVAAP
jgi:transposase